MADLTREQILKMHRKAIEYGLDCGWQKGIVALSSQLMKMIDNKEIKDLADVRLLTFTAKRLAEEKLAEFHRELDDAEVEVQTQNEQ